MDSRYFFLLESSSSSQPAVYETPDPTCPAYYTGLNRH
jgi:hypothetical protein